MKAVDKYDRLMINRSGHKGAFDRMRYTFSGTNATSNEVAVFFLELEYVNPYTGGNKVVLGFSKDYEMAPDTLSREASNANYPMPTFVCVRAGILGGDGKYMCSYYPYSEVTREKKTHTTKIGDNVFSPTNLKGHVVVSEDMDLSGYLCKAGDIQWDINLNRVLGSNHVARSKECTWQVSGGKALYSGTVTLDGKTYTIDPLTSMGYADHNWGETFPTPWYHISSSHMVSIITGKQLNNSFFAVQGKYKDTLAMLSSIEGTNISSGFSRSPNCDITWDCLQSPNEKEQPKLHWQSSFCNKAYIVDIDVYSLLTTMYMRDMELPQGARRLLKVLGGGDGTGEIRLYRRHGKTMELIEHANMDHCLCEYGTLQ